MVKRDLESEHIGSLLGFTWTFLNPIVMIVIYWAIFSVGFKVRPTHGAPFVVWLCAGMAIWLVFSNTVNGSSGVVVANSALLKKTYFPAQILPVVKTISSLVTHAIFLGILLVLILCEGVPFSIYYFQIFYYLFCTSVLALGLGWILSALNAFIRDIHQITNVLLQLGFWTTPIFWDISMMPEGFRAVLRCNPMFYVVQGYRDSLIYASPFWSAPLQTLVFWLFTLALFGSGAILFKRLQPHFADVL